MNPLSAGVIMLTLLDDHVGRKEINSIALKSTQTIVIAMLVVYLGGSYIFDFFGITPYGLQVFGGIILLVMGFNMVQGQGKSVNHTARDQEEAQERNDISTVPLAIPIVVGPGLATTLLNMSVSAKQWQDYVSAIAAILLCSLATLIIFRRMPFIKQKLGGNGLKVFNRLMGLIVGSLAIQMVVKGLMGLYTFFQS